MRSFAQETLVDEQEDSEDDQKTSGRAERVGFGFEFECALWVN